MAGTTDDSSTSNVPAGAQAYEAWAAEKGTPEWLVRAAAVGAGWALGALVTEGQYDQAVHQAAHAPIG